MNQEDDSSDFQDGALRHYEERVERSERELLDLRLNMALSVALAELQIQPGWGGLMDRLRGLETTYVRRLRSERLGKYRLGWLQGSLNTLSVFSGTKPMDQKALAEAERRCSDLEAQIAELRNLVAQ
jgi:hypothetical protein